MAGAPIYQNDTRSSSNMFNDLTAYATQDRGNKDNFLKGNVTGSLLSLVDQDTLDKASDIYSKQLNASNTGPDDTYINTQEQNKYREEFRQLADETDTKVRDKLSTMEREYGSFIRSQVKPEFFDEIVNNGSLELPAGIDPATGLQRTQTITSLDQLWAATKAAKDMRTDDLGAVMLSGPYGMRDEDPATTGQNLYNQYLRLSSGLGVDEGSQKEPGAYGDLGEVRVSFLNQKAEETGENFYKLAKDYFGYKATDEQLGISSQGQSDSATAATTAVGSRSDQVRRAGGRSSQQISTSLSGSTSMKTLLGE